jgi:hypothetical protein
MWEEGTVVVDKELYQWEAKVYETGSEYGINGGPVSKLNVWKKVNNDSFQIMVYDRGWITEEPKGKLKTVLETVLAGINIKMKEEY